MHLLSLYDVNVYKVVHINLLLYADGCCKYDALCTNNFGEGSTCDFQASAMKARPTKGGKGSKGSKGSKPTKAPKLRGCAANIDSGDCNGKCVWKAGYPPLEYVEDDQYFDQDGNALFVNGFDAKYAFGVDLNVVMLFGLLSFVMVIFYGCCFVSNEKMEMSETTPLKV